VHCQHTQHARVTILLHVIDRKGNRRRLLIMSVSISHQNRNKWLVSRVLFVRKISQNQNHNSNATQPHALLILGGVENDKTKTPWTSPRANYTDRATAVSEKLVPTFVHRWCHVVSYGSLRPYSRFSRPEPLLLPSSSSVVLTRLSGPRSRPTTQKIW
jgi:hypothetical protein